MDELTQPSEAPSSIPPPPNAYHAPDRPVVVYIIGSLQILTSLGLLAVLVQLCRVNGVRYVFSFQHQMLTFTTLVYYCSITLVLAACSGIGLLCFAPWARKVALRVAIWNVAGFVGFLASAYHEFPGQKLQMLAACVVMFLFALGINGTLFILMTRRSVREAFKVVGER